jgi:hypothetical protein
MGEGDRLKSRTVTGHLRTTGHLITRRGYWKWQGKISINSCSALRCTSRLLWHPQAIETEPYMTRDMQDQASLNNSLKERFQWNVMDSAPPQNRRIFNMACEKYDKWSQQESNHATPSFSSPYRPSRNSLHAPSSINVTAPSPDTPAPPHDGPGAAVKGRARSNSHTILLNRNGSVNTTDRSNGSPSIAWAQSRSDTSAHFSAVPELAAPSTLAPTQKLSRSISVFVAWKPEESFKAKP